MDQKPTDPGRQQHIFIVGAKSVGQYGGFEAFLAELIRQHRDGGQFRYTVTVKANGYGCMDESALDGVTREDKNVFIWQGARIVKLPVPQIGSAQAVSLDLKGLSWCLRCCETQGITAPVFYLLACRVGPFLGHYARRIHRLGGTLCVNPDGHEYLRGKWPAPVRAYWKLSERLTVRNADLMVCDSRRIEEYIRETYRKYSPKTVFIPYGTTLTPSPLGDSDPAFTAWLSENGLESGEYYMSCSRLVPENSYEIMLREYMRSKTRRPLVLITTKDRAYLESLRKKTGFDRDSRIRFVSPVYDRDLLRKIRENAFANLHGHTVGGTNPTLLEALAATKVNLLIDVPFNREVAQDAALYWTAKPGSLAHLIDEVDDPDRMTDHDRGLLSQKAKDRIRSSYTWEQVAAQYEHLWDALNNSSLLTPNS